MKYINLLVTLGLLTGGYVNAQVRPRPKAPPKPVTTQTATTEDGRIVVLSSDNTWKYAPDGAPGAVEVKTVGGRANSILSFETGLVFKSGDVKPVARATFHLLDDSLATILRDAGLHAVRFSGRIENTDDNLINTYASSVKFTSLDGYKEFLPPATAAIRGHIVQTVTTDFSGKASFEAVPSGTYYLMGISETPRGYVIWNLKVELKPGKNSVTLDQNNAVTAI